MSRTFLQQALSPSAVLMSSGVYVLPLNPSSGVKRLLQGSAKRRQACTLRYLLCLTNDGLKFVGLQKQHRILGMPMMRRLLRPARQRALGARIGGVAGLYSFFIAAMCLHALHVCANPLQPQSHWPTMSAILCHSPSFETDVASYSYSLIFRTRIVPRFPVKLRICSATTTGKI